MTLKDRVFLYKKAAKEQKERIHWIGILILVATLSFALGHIIGQDRSRAPIVISQCGLTEEQISR